MSTSTTPRFNHRATASAPNGKTLSLKQQLIKTMADSLPPLHNASLHQLIHSVQEIRPRLAQLEAFAQRLPTVFAGAPLTLAAHQPDILTRTLQTHLFSPTSSSANLHQQLATAIRARCHQIVDFLHDQALPALVQQGCIAHLEKFPTGALRITQQCPGGGTVTCDLLAQPTASEAARQRSQSRISRRVPYLAPHIAVADALCLQILDEQNVQLADAPSVLRYAHLGPFVLGTSFPLLPPAARKKVPHVPVIHQQSLLSLGATCLGYASIAAPLGLLAVGLTRQGDGLPMLIAAGLGIVAYLAFLLRK